jgi:hypothetical protein
VEFLNSDDWAEFDRRYPFAMSFLRGRSLAGELRYLRRESGAGRANSWQAARLEELEALKRSCPDFAD